MTRPAISAPWALDAPALTAELRVDPGHGLTTREADARRAESGPNELAPPRPVRWWQILGRQFRSLVVALLGAAAIVSLLFDERVEAAAIIAVLAVNTALGFFAELRAVRSMESLRQLGRQSTRVRRDAREGMVDDTLLVPGDIVLLEGGDRVAADLRILESAQLETDESILTGESLPVAKDADAVAEDAELHARTGMLHRGTTVTHGAATAVVVATGMETQIGHIAALVEATEDEATPLEQRLEELGRRLVWVTLAIAAVATAAGVAAGRDLLLMIQTGIALAVAAIPEGLPIVATIALARGMLRMARRNALVTRLATVETLGATTVILTDKTGTLTENRLSVGVVHTGTGQWEPGGDAPPDAAAETLRLGALCNDASLTADGGVGDPLEVALLRAATDAGIDLDQLAQDHPRVREVAFDSTARMMATYQSQDGAVLVAVKGAAEAVLEHCVSVRQNAATAPLNETLHDELLAAGDELAGRGFRVLAVASRSLPSADTEPYQELTFVGLLGLLDPPRTDVRAAMDACHTAGIRVVMVTGDQALTAAHIAREVHLTPDGEVQALTGRDLRDRGSGEAGRAELLAADVFARVDPEQKFDLVQLHQDTGAVVAMTGDGVNDAPALKKADIGIAMGKRGTQVARDAADMTLVDDSFASIVAAARQGRVIFANIRRFVIYLMSCNVSEIFIVTGAVAINAPLPLLPLQILFLNLVTDVFPALALALSEGDPELMERPPRGADEPILGRERWLRIVGFSAVITIATLGALAVAVNALGLRGPQAISVSFATLALAQLWHVFNLRDRDSGFVHNDIVGNRWVWAALALCVLLVAAAVHVPGLSAVLGTASPGLYGWGLIVGMSLVPLAAGQLWLHWRRSPDPSGSLR